MTACCLWSPDKSLCDLPSLPTICDAHRQALPVPVQPVDPEDAWHLADMQGAADHDKHRKDFEFERDAARRNREGWTSEGVGSHGIARRVS